MRLVVCAFVLIVTSSLAVEAAPLAGRSNSVVVIAEGPHVAVPICYGCGCRGGPGYRLPSGKCASRRR